MEKKIKTDHLNVFLIRHGESADHEGDKRQRPDSSLGDRGREQAKAVAERMLKEDIDVVFSSKLNRARETAEEISKKLGISVEIFEGIHEKEQNPDLYGADMASEVHQRYIAAVEKFGHDFDWKFDGKGESLNDLIKRANKFQEHLLKNHKKQNVLVVTHGLFIRAFVILSLLGDNFDEKTFYKIFTSISFANTGVTLLEYSSDRKHWELRYMNDHLHIR